MNELTTNAAIEIDGSDFVGQLTTRDTMFCSMNPTNDEERARLYNAMNSPDKRLSDCINTVIYCKDIFCEVVNLEKRDANGIPVTDENGEIITSSCPRIVLIDSDGIGYQCVSLGVFGSIKKLIASFGAPTWENPLPLEVVQVSKGARKLLTLRVKL